MSRVLRNNGICSFEGCRRQAHARGLCQVCYNRQRRLIVNNPCSNPNCDSTRVFRDGLCRTCYRATERLCSSDGCTGRVLALGLCSTCYNRQRNQLLATRQCATDGCSNGVHRANLCRSCYSNSGELCGIEECEQPVHANGLCQAHYDNQRHSQPCAYVHPVTRLSCKTKVTTMGARYCNKCQTRDDYLSILENDTFPHRVSAETLNNILRQTYERLNHKALHQKVCAVCEQRVPVVGSSNQTLHEKSISECSHFLPRLIWLANENVTEHGRAFLRQCFTYGHPDLDGKVLAVEGIIKPSSDPLSWKIRICGDCYDVLKVDGTNIPSHALANHTYAGPIPPELKELSVLEQLVIARCRFNNIVVKMKRSVAGVAQRGLRAHVFVFKQDPDKILNVLPPPVDDLTKFVKVILVGSLADGEESVILRRHYSVLRVRINKIRNALVWLKRHNPYYQNVILSEENLSGYPADDVPSAITSTLTSVHDPSRRDERVEGGGIQYEQDNHEQEGFNTSFISEDNADCIPLSDYWRSMLDENFSVEDVALMTRGQLVNTFKNMDLYGMGFPCLYPFGIGLPFLALRRLPLTLLEHVKLLLRRGDRRFIEHNSFMFIVYDLLQTLDVCSKVGASLKNYPNSAIQELMSDEFKEMLQEAMDTLGRNERLPPNHPAHKVMNNLKLQGSRVKGSPLSKIQCRNQLKSLFTVYGLPSLYITISPSDLANPIPLVLAGEDVNLDKILPKNSKFLNAHTRAKNAAANPVALCEYFYTLVDTVLNTLFGYGSKDGGIFGHITSYYGMVEAQNRGALHVHMCVWLNKAPTGEDLYHKLCQDSDFRERFRSWLNDIVSVDIGYFEQVLANDDCLDVWERYVRDNTAAYENNETENSAAEDVLPDTTKETPITYHPMLNPSHPDYNVLQQCFIAKSARSSQLHSCNPFCLKEVKTSRGIMSVCKRRMPRRCFDEDTFDPETGEFSLRRVNGYVNPFNKHICLVANCNNDIQYIWGGSKAMAVLYYIANYITKVPDGVDNYFALTKAAMQSLQERPMRPREDFSEAQNNTRAFMIRVINKINVSNQVCACLVANYLLGLPDHYTPNKFESLSVFPLVSRVLRIFGSNHRFQRMDSADVQNDVDDSYREDDNEEIERQFTVTREFSVGVPFDVHYMHRPLMLEHLSYYDFKRYFRVEKMHQDSPQPSRDMSFLPTHPRPDQYRIVARRECVVPVLNASHADERSENPCIQLKYYVTMLLLFHPWREPMRDLFPEEINTLDALRRHFHDWKNNNSPQHVQDYISNFNKLNISKAEAARDRAARDQREDYAFENNPMTNIDNVSPDEAQSTIDDIPFEDVDIEAEPDPSDVTLRLAPWDYLPNCVDHSLDQRAKDALDTLNLSSSFSTNDAILPGPQAVNNEARNILPPTTYTSLHNQWHTQLLQAKMSQEHPESSVRVDSNRPILPATVLPLHHSNVRDVPTENSEPLHGNDSTIRNVHPLIDPFIRSFNLKGKQVPAFAIPAIQFLRRNAGQNPPPMRHYVGGEGGTGKSRVIKAIIAFYKYHNARKRLKVAATTGRAAVGISGETLHSAFGVNVDSRRKRKDPVARAQSLQSEDHIDIDTLLVDEVSMSPSKLWDQEILPAIKLLRKADSSQPLSLGFGLDYIFVGDFYQHDPVKRSGKPIYLPVPEGEPGHEMWRLWNSLTSAIILTENHRTPDPVLGPILNSMRERRLTVQQLEVLYSRLISNHTDVNLLQPGWRDAPFITTIHKVRLPVNTAIARREARLQGKTLFIVPSVDTVDDKIINHPYKFESIRRNCSTSQKENLERVLPLFEGARIVLTYNVQAKIGLCNGGSGVVEKIYPLECSTREIEDGTMILTRPPLLAVRLDNPPDGVLPDFGPLIPAGCVPVLPRKDYCQEKYLTAFVTKSPTFSFYREQLPITLGYAITDYKAQGGSWDRVILDLRKSPAFSPATLYVMCSRVRSLDGLMILGMPGDTFESTLNAFNRPLSPELIQDTRRIQMLSDQTEASFWQSLQSLNL